MDDLEDFLKGNEQPVEAVEPVEAPEPTTEAAPVAPEAETAEAKAERIRDEKGRFAPKGEEAAPPADTEQHSIPPKALQEERRKRQELEAQLADLRASLQPQQPPADIWEDTQGWQQQFGGSILSEANRLSRINASEMAARIKHDDFDQMFDKFNEMAAMNPSLVNQTMDASGTPSWLKAYDIAKNAAKAEQFGAVDIDDLRAKLREELKAEMAAQRPAPVTPPVPETLADAQSARGSSAPLTVPTLDQILGRSS